MSTDQPILIVGLGNPGERYASTRHNLGFMVADELASDLELSFSPSGSAKALVAGRLADRAIIAKPQTMMNLSGQAVGELGRYYKISPDNIWVIYDDVDLPFGRLRTRGEGSSGGHNGIKSIIEHVGERFGRIRLGVRNEHFDATATDRFVLDKFSSTERAELNELVEAAALEVKEYLAERGGLADHSLDLLS